MSPDAHGLRGRTEVDEGSRRPVVYLLFCLQDAGQTREQLWTAMAMMSALPQPHARPLDGTNTHEQEDHPKGLPDRVAIEIVATWTSGTKDGSQQMQGRSSRLIQNTRDQSTGISAPPTIGPARPSRMRQTPPQTPIARAVPPDR